MPPVGLRNEHWASATFRRSVIAHNEGHGRSRGAGIFNESKAAFKTIRGVQALLWDTTTVALEAPDLGRPWWHRVGETVAVEHEALVAAPVAAQERARPALAILDVTVVMPVVPSELRRSNEAWRSGMKRVSAGLPGAQQGNHGRRRERTISGRARDTTTGCPMILCGCTVPSDPSHARRLRTTPAGGDDTLSRRGCRAPGLPGPQGGERCACPQVRGGGAAGIPPVWAARVWVAPSRLRTTAAVAVTLPR